MQAEVKNSNKNNGITEKKLMRVENQVHGHRFLSQTAFVSAALSGRPSPQWIHSKAIHILT
jgi:hypothetical protein